MEYVQNGLEWLAYKWGYKAPLGRYTWGINKVCRDPYGRWRYMLYRCAGQGFEKPVVLQLHTSIALLKQIAELDAIEVYREVR